MKTISNVVFAVLTLTTIVGAGEPDRNSATPAPVARTTMAAPDIGFGPDGSVTSLILEQGGSNLVDRSQPGRGFYLETWTSGGMKQYRLDRVRREGTTLVVSRDRVLPRFTFEMTSKPHYLALKLKRVEGIPANQMSLRLEIRCRSGIVAQNLGYMASHIPWVGERRDPGVTGAWNYLWHRNPKDPLGGIAMYPAGEPDKEDEALLEAWVNEDLLSRPTLKEPWTKERARQWLEDFEKRFSDQTMMTLGAQSPEELYAMTAVAERIGIRQVYLHTDTWRGEYWPVTQSHVYINPKVFPGGLEDLKKYSAYLRQRGMLLKIHTTSAGIGPRDPKRIAGHVSRDLACWGMGTMEESLAPDAKNIRFRPSPGTSYPFSVDWWGTGQRGNIPDFFSFSFVRVGDEIVEVGAFEDTDQPVWKLTGCRRGIGATQAAAHVQGEEAAGLLSAYGQNFVPDVDSPLLEEMAREYADLANAIGLSYLEYDALEDNCYPPWGGNKYTELVQRRMDHPVITHTSGGTFVPSNIEFKFHRYQYLFHPPFARASFITENAQRRATPETEFNSSLAQGIAQGSINLGISKSQAMFGINQALLAGHGLSGQFLEDFRRWHAVARLITSEQRKALKQALAASPAGKRTLIAPVFAQGYMGAGIRETRDAYEVVARRFLTQPTDAPAMVGVESAAQTPRQFIQPGQALQFTNPYAAQPLTWTIRVLAETGQDSSAAPMAVSEGRNETVAQYLTGVASPGAGGPPPVKSLPVGDDRLQRPPGGDGPPPVKSLPVGDDRLQRPPGGDGPPPVKSLPVGDDRLQRPLGAGGPPPVNPPAKQTKTTVAVALQPKASEVQNQRYAKFEQEGNAVVVSAENPGTEDFWKGDDLPRWARAVAMPGHGISLEVTGDGSGAVLVVQLLDGGGSSRDYVVKVDFSGKRTIVIPTGEVSWADGRWGRRGGTEWFRYDGISAVAMGFGFIPAKTSPRVKVENLQLLADSPSRLVNPVVTVAGGELQITGEVESGRYLRYTGGDKVGVYDENWHLLRQLPVTLRNYTIPAGPGSVSVRVAEGAPRPWLETQFFVEDQPIRIPKALDSVVPDR